MPAVLLDGVIAPVVELMVNPAGVELYVPPLEPDRVTDCAVLTEVQYGLPV